MKGTALTVSLAGLSGACAAFSPTWHAYAVARFLTGASVLGFYMTTFVLVVEALGSKYQAVVGVLSGVPFAIGELLFAVVRKYT